MKALVMTTGSLFRLSQFSISPEWFGDFGSPDGNCGLKRLKVNEFVYIIEDAIDTDDIPIIVINISDTDSVFSDRAPNPSILERVIATARSIYSNSVVIPSSWRPHYEGSLISIQVPTRDGNWRARLHFETRPRGARDLFVFSRKDEIFDFDELNLHLSIYDEARTYLQDAILSPPQATQQISHSGIVLTHRLPQGFVQGASLDQWYTSKLTTDQRNFVDKPYDGPVRLRGAAGTGKTLSLVIKFLRDGLSAEEREEKIKLGFITHSSASVDLVNAIGENLDTKGLLYDIGRYSRLEIRTLYDLAQEHLRFDLDNLRPLSIDGREGRHLQFELIGSVLQNMAKSPILTLQFDRVTSSLKSRWIQTESSTDRSLIAEIMNEFASVLDAESIRAGEEKGERYAKSLGQRSPWLMALPLEIDRRFVLEVHRQYRKLLSDMNTLSVDQMISDFNSFLDSNRWDQLRTRSGFDALFVDELHLFTSIERQTLHKLIKVATDDDGRPKRPPIFMAYDMKQSPRDTFAHFGDAHPNLFGATTGLQNSELVKLDRVFRYTPEIAEFLFDLDATFPAVDVPSEWDAYAGKAELGSGKKPEIVAYSDDAALFKDVFGKAARVARSIDGGGRRVAVLCASEDMFDVYLKAARGQFPGEHVPITSREPSSELRHAGKRFVFSMPEYVAGLQFDTVFLMHVDVAEAPADASDGMRRRFISNLYLGSSRAETTLQLSASVTRGGISDVLRMAIDRGSLIQATSSELYHGARKRR
jgi:hypothetical protein